MQNTFIETPDTNYEDSSMTDMVRTTRCTTSAASQDEVTKKACFTVESNDTLSEITVLLPLKP